MLHPDDRNLSAKYTARILDTCGHGFTQDQIYRLLGKDGYHWVTDATTLVKSGNQIFFQGDITDITDFVKDKEKKEPNPDSYLLYTTARQIPDSSHKWPLQQRLTYTPWLLRS